MGWPRQARTREAGKPASERVGQQGSLLLASHQACQEHGWFLPHGRGGVERGGGSCPPMGEPSINLVRAYGNETRSGCCLLISVSVKFMYRCSALVEYGASFWSGHEQWLAGTWSGVAMARRAVRSCMASAMSWSAGAAEREEGSVASSMTLSFER